jgi:hypothetical protein
MNLVGDSDGLTELKRMSSERKDFLKFLITEAKTSFKRSADFKGADGRRWRLTYNGQRDELEIQPAVGDPESRFSENGEGD